MEFDPTGIFTIGAGGAVLFAAAGKKAGQPWWAWAIWGLLIALTVGTTTVGLAHAAALPYTAAKVQSSYVIGAVLAFAIMIPIAWYIIYRSRAR